MINFIKEKSENFRRGKGQEILESRINENSQPAKTDFSSRMIPASLVGLLTAAGTIGANKFFKLNAPRPIIASTIAAATAAGFMAPDAYNAVLKNKNKVEELSNLQKMESRIGYHAGDIYSRYEELNKSAGWGGAIKPALNIGSKVIGGVGRTAATAGQLFLHGMKKVPKEAGLPEKAFGAATKLVAAGGATLAGKKAYDVLKAPRSEGNYDTFLRNNLMAGNIKPQEVPQSDMAGVQRLGMR